MRPELSSARRPAICIALALGVFFCAAPTGASAQASSPSAVGVFPATPGEPPAPWRVIRLNPKIATTQYRLRVWDGVAGVEARAQASMALLARPLTLDLKASPILCWRWRVEGVVKSANLATKAGDDYAARVYVAFGLPPELLGLGLRAKLGIARSLYGDHVPDAALNYIWDNRHPVGTRAFNAYTDRTQMIVRRSGALEAGAWVTERVDVLQDAEQAFGTDQVQAQLLAVASDTDNTGEQAHAGFADLHFVARDAPCRFPALIQTP